MRDDHSTGIHPAPFPAHDLTSASAGIHDDRPNPSQESSHTTAGPRLAPTRASTLRWQLAPGVSLIAFPGREALFCEAAQELYAIDPLGALIAHGLAAQATAVDGLVQHCVDHGVDAGAAPDAVAALMRLWSDAGLLAAIPEANGETARRLRFRLADQSIDVTIDAPCPPIVLPVPAVEKAAPSSVPCWHLLSETSGSDIILARAGRPARIVTPEQAVPTLKARLVEDALAASGRIALHAASLVRQGRALLLCGDPGAGKSTLCVALTGAGYGYAADDVTLIDADGAAQGLCFFPTLKAGSWNLVPHCCTALERAPVHRRLDGALLRYVPMPEPQTGRYPVGWIVLLDRRDDVPAKLDPVDPVTALQTLFRGAYSSKGRSSAADVRMMGELVAGAQCLRLTYSSLPEAVDLLDRAGQAG
ncbi:hypothetical protein WBP06_18690 [Novosphingobium sp. BL-8H]|uniref:hypothetical protein n=1 Tax=Novosphingobium sp. BL-8H TaxID=3127640 RepID=UPI003758191A